MMRRRAYPAGFVDQITEHVVAFTLGGLDGVANASPRARKQRQQEAKA